MYVSYGIQFALVAYYTFIIISLPQMDTRRATALVYAAR